MFECQEDTEQPFASSSFFEQGLSLGMAGQWALSGRFTHSRPIYLLFMDRPNVASRLVLGIRIPEMST
jgi:hypothetical protein